MKNFKNKTIGTAALTGAALSALVLPTSALVANAQDASQTAPATSDVREAKDATTPTPAPELPKLPEAVSIEDVLKTGEGDGTTALPETVVSGTVENAPATTDKKEEKESNATLRYQNLIAKAGEQKMVSVINDGTTDLSGYKFALNTEGLPEGWTVSVDEPTGIITATVAANATPGQYVTVPVTATKDGAETLRGVVTVAAEGMKDIHQPSYTKITIAAGVKGTTDQANTDLPEGTTFALADTFPFNDYKDYTFEVDPETGVLTVVVPENATTGTITLPVLTTYTDGTSEIVDVEIDVKGAPAKEDEKEEDEKEDEKTEDTLAAAHKPVYAATELRAGGTALISQTGENTPENTVFALAESFKTPEGFTVAIDANTGHVTVAAVDNVAVGTELDIPVVATYSDGSKNTTTVPVKVIAANPDKGLAETHTPGYKKTVVKAGENLTVKQSGDLNLPEGTKFALDENYVAQGWKVTVGATSGDVVITAPKDAKAGDFVELPIIATYPDGTTDRATLLATVVEDEKVADKDGEKTVPTDKKGTDAPIINVESDTPDVDVKVDKERKRGFLDYFTRWFESPTAEKVVEGVSDNAVAYQLSQAAKHNTPLPATGVDGKTGPAVHTGGQVEK